MNEWKVDFRSTARAEYRILKDQVRREVVDILWELREEGPDIFGAIMLRSNRDTWRVRFFADRYRLLYEVSRRKRTIMITRLGPRAFVYRGIRG